MNIDDYIDDSRAFAALGHKSRLAIFTMLLGRPLSGFRFGEVREVSNIPNATLSHHLNELEKGGLIERIVDGRNTSFRPRINYVQDILTRMTDQCCAHEKETGHD